MRTKVEEIGRVGPKGWGVVGRACVLKRVFKKGLPIGDIFVKIWQVK